ncbi:hypothetical protein Bca4012_018344 [Brassica carinata]
MKHYNEFEIEVFRFSDEGSVEKGASVPDVRLFASWLGYGVRHSGSGFLP